LTLSGFAIAERYRRRESLVKEAGDVRNVSLLVVSAINSEEYREILGFCEGAKEDKSGWSAILRHLVDRGMRPRSKGKPKSLARTWRFWGNYVPAMYFIF